MIELGIVDLSASARRKLAALVERWAWVAPDSRISIPRISLQLLSPEEVRFHGGLDVCVVGPDLIACDAAYLTTLRKELADKLILCVLDARTQSFGVVEQLGRLGVDDVLLDTAQSDEFVRRLVLLQRRLRSRQRGIIMMVDAARGGVGATFCTAAVAEALVAQGLSVCAVDCDSASQDLTRFLRVKPHLSEPLRLLVGQERLITGETVAECTVPVWADEPLLCCMPPAADSNDTLVVSREGVRSFVSVIETLAVLHERVVIDSSPLSPAARHALAQVADEALFVANRDPAGAFANRQALSVLSGAMRGDAVLRIVLNDSGGVAASRALLRKEVLTVVGRPLPVVEIPHTRRAARWACSGQTPYRFLRRHVQALISPPLHRPKPGRLGGGRDLCADVLKRAWRATAVAGWWGRKRGNEPGQAKTGGSSEPRYEPLTIGFGTPMLEAGELVSKPVMLG